MEKLITTTADLVRAFAFLEDAYLEKFITESSDEARGLKSRVFRYRLSPDTPIIMYRLGDVQMPGAGISSSVMDLSIASRGYESVGLLDEAFAKIILKQNTTNIRPELVKRMKFEISELLLQTKNEMITDPVSGIGRLKRFLYDGRGEGLLTVESVPQVYIAMSQVPDVFEKSINELADKLWYQRQTYGI